MATEIERKWLVPELPEPLAWVSADPIDQGYLVVGEDGSEVRVRRNQRGARLTFKSGGGLTRTEVEIGLSAEQFEQLWQVTDGRRVSKRRINLDGGVDIDVYAGALKGLIVAEVEFPSEEAATSFVAPGWFGAEVTEDRAYKNQNLALKGLPSRD